VGRRAEAGGDAVTVGAVHHAVHDPVAAGLDALACGVIQLHPGLVVASCHSGNLRDCRVLLEDQKFKLRNSGLVVAKLQLFNMYCSIYIYIYIYIYRSDYMRICL
jgi:hypothetical protein